MIAKQVRPLQELKQNANLLLSAEPTDIQNIKPTIVVVDQSAKKGKTSIKIRSTDDSNKQATSQLSTLLSE